MSLQHRFILILSIALLTSLGLLKADPLNPLTAEDMHKLKRMGSPEISPDGKYIVYSVRKWNPDGKVNTYLEYINLQTNKTFPLTDSEARFSDSNPAFSVNFPSTLLFLSSRSGSSQIHLVEFPPAAEGQIPTPTQFTFLDVDVNNIRWKANTITFTAEIFSVCSDLKCTADKNAEVAARGLNTWQVYEKLFVRHWDKYDEGKVSHLFFFKVGKADNPENKQPVIKSVPIELLKGQEANTPVPPDGDVSHYDLSADGSLIAFTAHLRTRDEAWNTAWKIYFGSLTDVSNLKMLTQSHQGRTQNPRFSPNGKYLSYLYMNRAGLESDSLLLKLYDIESKKFQDLTGNFDRSIMEYSWVNDDYIFFSAAEAGTEKTFSVKVALGKDAVIATQLDDSISSAAPLAYKQSDSLTLIYLVRNSFTLPQDLWAGAFSNGSVKNLTQLTFLNKEAISKFNLVTPELFFFTGGYGDKVQGWVFKPINFTAGKKHPLAFIIHGGPESPFIQSWSYRWNPQLWTSRGYAVLMINPHGSPGQGQKFTDGVLNDWGGVPYQDLMSGLDFIGKNYDWIDTQNACALGASYGGFMVNWIQGQTDRFKCLVTHDGVFSTVSMFYATEELWFPMAEYCPVSARGCKPWEPEYRKFYTKFSPEEYVANWKTPHFVIHSSMDYRIPISEGLSVFTALQVKNIPSKFLRFTEENHWVLKAENSIKWYSEVLGWLDKWTQSGK